MSLGNYGDYERRKKFQNLNNKKHPHPSPFYNTVSFFLRYEASRVRSQFIFLAETMTKKYRKSSEGGGVYE